ncbi:MAG: 50S ribosomal protein L4 [Patescibacteria group bacterium]|nr:50S ribosomal protein L4 [Patescibacteria group bacterium]
MPKAPLYNQKGERKGEVTLNASIFDIPFNKDLVHQALVRQLSNKRLGTAHTKTQADVRGGGAKPFRQKGTGRARQGSLRTVNLRGGGVVFGPTNERNWKKDMPRKQRRKALFSALSEKVRENKVLALEEYKAKTPKTKDFIEMIKKMAIEKDLLLVLPEKHESLEKSARNITTTKTILVNYLNIQDLIKYDKVLFLKDALDKMEKLFL